VKIRDLSKSSIFNVVDIFIDFIRKQLQEMESLQNKLLLVK
jgi:hypothetical protein